MIEIDGLCKDYATERGSVHALADISLTADTGEFVSIVGPSGCGKSTLMMVIAGLRPLTDGQVRVAGNPVDGPQTEVGIVFQTDVLLDWRTNLDNILLQTDLRRLPKRQYADRAHELLNSVGLDGFADRRPYELSGGMRQRVSICRALIHDPPLLLMDEPFGALDALTREQMMLDLQRIWLERRKTVLFITHSISEAVFLSDRVIVMTPRPGRVAEELVIALPRPRSLDVESDQRFGEYTRHIRNIFEREGVLQNVAVA